MQPFRVVQSIVVVIMESPCSSREESASELRSETQLYVSSARQDTLIEHSHNML